MQTKKVYQEIASKLQAIENCEKNDNTVWFHRHHESLDEIEGEYLPSGSGIDSGCTIDRDKSTPQKIVIQSGYHRMNGDSGMYDGWFHFTVIIAADLAGEISIKLKFDKDFRRNTKDFGTDDYLFDVFDTALRGKING